MITREQAKALWRRGNNSGCGYAPVAGDDTVDAAIEAAQADGWEVIHPANTSDQIAVLRNRDNTLLGIGDAHGAWAVVLSDVCDMTPDQRAGVINNAELAAADEQYEESDARECVVATLDGCLDLTPEQDEAAVIADAMTLWIETFRAERLHAAADEVAIVVWGHGASQIPAVREAESDANSVSGAAGRQLAARGLAERDGSGWVLLADAWCVTIPAAAVDAAELDRDGAILGYCEVTS